MTKSRNECFVSVASGWEIAIKVSLGKLRIDGALDRSLPEPIAAARGTGPRGGAGDGNRGSRRGEVWRESDLVKETA
jgi:hypothetical protein